MPDVAERERVNLVAASRIVNVTASTVRYWIITGLLRAERVRGHWIIDVDDLLEADRQAKQKTKAGLRGRRGTYVPAPEG